MSQVLLPLTLQDSGIESIPPPPQSRYSREVALEIIWNSFPPLCKWVLGRDRAGGKAGLGEASMVEEGAFFI